MALISRSLPNIIGGQSQQPASQRAINQVEVMLNAIPDITKGVVKRPGTQHRKTIGEYSGARPFYHATRRDSLNKFHYLITRENGVTDLKVFDNDGNSMTLNRNTSILTNYLDSETPHEDYQAVSLSDVTYIVNKTKHTAKSSSLSTVRPDEGIVYFRGVNYTTTYTVTVSKNGTTKTHSFTTPSATQSDAATAQWAENVTNVENVVNDFYSYFSSNLPTGMSVNKVGATIHFYNTSVSENSFTLTATDSAGGLNLNAFKDYTESLTDLPNIAPQNFEIIIKGANDKTTDDYTVRCDGSGWAECIAQGVSYNIDVTTMPIQIRLDNNGEFYMEYMSFEDRVVGDDVTNPFPSFIGNRIFSIFFYKDRLGFLSNENLVLSRLNSYGDYDFFQVTTLTSLDTDPIDISVTTDFLYNAIPFSGSLLLFSEHYQFKLTSNGPLTNATAQVSNTTNFNADKLCSPVGVGKYAYFASKRGVFGTLFEFEADATSSVFIASIDDATEVSEHCPELLKGNVTKLNVSPNNKIIIVETDDDLSSMYIYKYFWKEKQKVQSAWCSWSFSGDVLGSNLEGDELSLIMLREGYLYFEQLNLNQDEAEIENGAFSVHLDRRVRLSKTGTSVLPYNTVEEIVFVDNNGLIYNKTDAYLAIQNNTIIWAGTSFTKRIEFSEAFVETNSISIVTAKLQLRRYYIVYESSCYFSCHKKGKNSFKEFNARYLSDSANIADGIVRSSGIFRFSCSGRSTKSRAVLENNSHLPSQIMSASWEAYLTNRSQPM
jgi:hypothetical protein